VGPADAAPDAAETSAVIERGLAGAVGFARDAGLSPADAGPASFALHAERAPAEWCESVAEATRRIRAGGARKVVLARAVEVVTDHPMRAGAILGQLRRSYPSSHLFSVDGFVGATPELLVARAGDRVRAHPMAGTAPRSGDPRADARLAEALVASRNTRDEHRHTIDMVHDTLLPWCSYLDEEAEPSIVAMANVQHLATRLEGKLSAPAASVLELVAALHPTPAVGGAPRDAALAMIEELEQLDRGRYAGPVGWIDAAGNGTWAVGIRSAELSGTRARVFAGVGVVADSVPASELAETRTKMQAVLGALVRP
jgi:isochorismate synthase